MKYICIQLQFMYICFVCKEGYMCGWGIPHCQNIQYLLSAVNATSALMLPPQWFLIIKWIVPTTYKLITRCVHFIKSVSAKGKSFLHLSRRVSGCNINNMPNNSRPNNGNKSVTTQPKDKVKLVATTKQLQVRNDNWHELAETPSCLPPPHCSL